MYLHCPRCRLTIKCRTDYLTLTSCPRCLARAAIVTELFSSPLNGLELRALDRDGIARDDPSALADARAHTTTIRHTRPW